MRRPALLSFALALVAATPAAFGWGEPHLAITKAAVASLPDWQREVLGEEAKGLGDGYCLIPDNVYTDRKNARFAAMDSRPGEAYLLNLHLPALQPENFATLSYFMGKAVEALRARDVAAAARFMGTVCHQIEDYGSPAHTVPGDNMFTLLQQFLPPSPAMGEQPMHGPIENGTFSVSIEGYRPQLLGTTVEEASWRMLHRLSEVIVNARSTTIPIIQALYAEDKETVTKHQMRAAIVDAQATGDALYTMVCLGTERMDAAEKERLQTVPIGSFFPLEAENLYYSQKQFSGAPNWGHAWSGVILAEGKRAEPLKLRTETAGEKVFANGISVVMGKTLTFHLPKGVYGRFTVLGGLHPELGAEGKVEFTINADGKPLAKAVVAGTEAAHAFECDFAGVSEIQLAVTSKGDPKKAYAIWGDPVLHKAP